MRLSLATVAALLSLILNSAPGLAQWHGADVPDSLSFQGFVTDTNGVGINTTADITFRLYKGSTQIWSQTKAGTVISNGVFNVILGGTGDASLNTVAFNEPIDLEIKYGNLVLAPRTPLTSVPYALAIRGMYAVDAVDGFDNVAPNLIGGASNNYVAGHVVGATIGGGGGWFGGGSVGIPDSVLGDWGTVSGGASNTASGPSATVGGGFGNSATGNASVVAGGFSNSATGKDATVAGGNQNGGTGTGATIGGGTGNEAAGSHSVVAGGSENAARGSASGVLSGDSNTAAVGGRNSVIAGGVENYVAGNSAFIGGGFGNSARGAYSTIPGGRGNVTRNGYTFASGYRARAVHSGTFVWADSTGPDGTNFESTDYNQFLIRAGGGVGIGTNTPDAQLDVAGAIHSSGPNSSTIIYKGTNKSGMPDGDGFRMTYDTDFFGSNADALVFEKTDANQTNPDGGIAFINSGSGGSQNVAMVIRGNGNVGIGTKTPLKRLHVRGDYYGRGHMFLHAFGGDSTSGIAYIQARDLTTTSNIGMTLRTKEGASIHDAIVISPNGDVTIAGNLSKPGGSFKIDHPLDPENRYLYHSFVESPDMMNVYNGNVILDENGDADVKLPSYFDALNRNFRYQLTAIGAPGPNLHVAEKISRNQFSIAGGTPGMEVSWQITGVRKDPYAEHNRIQVEVDKPAEELGTYLHPEVYTGTNQPISLSSRSARNILISD